MGGLFKATRRERRHAIPPPPPLGRPLFNRLAVWSFILSLYPIATPYVPIILGFVARSQMKERPAMGLRNEEVAWQSPRSLLVSSGRLCSSCGWYSCPWERKGGPRSRRTDSSEVGLRHREPASFGEHAVQLRQCAL